MITRFRVQNYKALKDVTLDLTPIHVLIGANDTGKTSILEAIATICRSTDLELPQAFLGAWDGRAMVWQNAHDLPIRLRLEGNVAEERVVYELECAFPDRGRGVVNSRERGSAGRCGGQIVDLTCPNAHTTGARAFARAGSGGNQAQQDMAKAIRQLVGGVQYCRWDPCQLALPVAPSAARRFRIEPSGFGLALCLDDILGYERRRFDKLEERFRTLFPQVESIQLVRQAAYDAPVDDPEMVPKLQAGSGKGIQFRFAGGNEIAASQVSDGMLIVLAYLTTLYLPTPPQVLLVEEPENGVHPKRLQDVVSILREIVGSQTHTQIVITTHSPMLIDLFSPEEVTLCQKSPDGSVSVRRLSESATVREQMDVFTLGEIWAGEGDEALAKPISESGGSAP